MLRSDPIICDVYSIWHVGLSSLLHHFIALTATAAVSAAALLTHFLAAVTPYKAAFPESLPKKTIWDFRCKMFYTLHASLSPTNSVVALNLYKTDNNIGMLHDTNIKKKKSCSSRNVVQLCITTIQ